uniref:Response regulatory domain-containing protein n=1 Tax=Ganoderma boninense TaxID=34458 RepID=A0A5K1K0W9_9APHY|nr:Response regulatory domain-containing protein [Ganoderma boninense]
MLTHSSTRDPLAPFTADHGLSPSPSDDHLKPEVPFPVMSRPPTRASTASYSSTTPLNSDRQQSDEPRSFLQRLFGWKQKAKTVFDREAQHLGYPPFYDKGGGPHEAPQISFWHGWRLILFDSWLNLLIFMLPVAGILKITTASETLIFLHDLATGVVSRRIGGSKTGLLNSSLLVVIGAMLSKLLLVLGMCFFAGGIRFSEQGFDSTATQIHSSLLSISVGAVLLPAAFHFALSYSNQDKGEAQTTLKEQKADILRMSHGVAIVLLIIYISYLIFQLWSHTHLYQDNRQPSARLPAAASVHTATTRLREKSSSIYGRVANARSIENFRRASIQTFRTLGHNDKSPSSSRAPSPGESSLKPNSPSEISDTARDLGEAPMGGPGSFLRSQAHVHAGSLTGSDGRLSPFTSSSQVTLSNPIALPGESTVRLVSSKQEQFVIRRASSSDSDRSTQDAPVSRPASDMFESDDERGRRRDARGRSRTPISDVLSAYYSESLKGNSDEGSGRRMSPVNLTPNPAWHRGRFVESPTEYLPSSPVSSVPGPQQPEMSWPLTLFLLSAVTVLVAVNAEWLVDSMDHLSPLISKEWIGLILLPTVSVMAECVTAVNVAAQDQLTLSISVAVGSTIQTALFVIPCMVILGWILDKPLALLFDPFESVVLYISVHTMGYVVADGKSNWLEGVILMCLYIVIAVTFWFYPGSNFSSNLAVCTTTPFSFHV